MSEDDDLPEPALLVQLPDATTRVVPATVVEQLELLPVLEPEQSGPPQVADIGRSIGIPEVCARWGISEAQCTAIHAVARRNRVTIDMRARPLVAGELISSGVALARPSAIPLVPIDELDVALGVAGPAAIGLIFVVDPSRLAVPADDQGIEPAERDRLRARLLLRRAERQRTKDAIDALVGTGTIRIELDGLIVNTGLAGPNELPFAMDNQPIAVHDLQGRPVDDATFEVVVAELIRADTGVTRVRTDIVAVDSPLTLVAPVATGRGDERPEQQVPCLRLGDGSPMVVGHPASPRGSQPATTIDLADPSDHGAARQTFADLVVRHPRTEFALMTNGVGGEWFIVRGTSSAMRAALTAVGRMAVLPTRWHVTVEAWSRVPDEGLGYVPEHRRLPSGRHGDFDIAAAIALRDKAAVRLEIHFIDEHHQHAVTTFGIDPDEPEPFHIDVPRIGHHRERQRFATLESYDEWLATQVRDHPPDVIDRTSMPTLIDFEREPQWVADTGAARRG